MDTGPERDGAIVLVELSRVHRDVMNTLCREISRTFGLPVAVRGAVRNLAPAHDPGRRQYSSPYLLQRLRRIKKGANDRVLGIVDVDLYSPGYEFVFGEADICAGVATLSLKRLKRGKGGGSAARKLLAQRAVKEATHELGHLFGLGHCPNPQCVMCVCTSVPRVDAKTKEFCGENGCTCVLGRVSFRG